jgi:hypothetical protein
MAENGDLGATQEDLVEAVARAIQANTQCEDDFTDYTVCARAAISAVAKALGCDPAAAQTDALAMSIISERLRVRGP